MTILELLDGIAANDDLPRSWRVVHEQIWLLEVPTTEVVSSTRLEYKANDSVSASPPWTPCASLDHTDDRIDKIVVRRNVVASILIPLQAVAGPTPIDIERVA